MHKILFFLVGLAMAQNLIGDFEYFSSLNSINHLNRSNDTLIISTNNGVYFYNTSTQKQSVINRKDGLYESDTRSTQITSYGLVAIGKKGSISIWNSALQKFSLWHSSYASAEYSYTNQKIINKDRYLIIPFTQGLSFFDLKSGSSFLTINKIGKYLLLDNPIKDILLVDNFLYVLIENTLYNVPVNLNNLDSTIDTNNNRVNHVDPIQWQVVKDSIDKSVNQLVFNDSIQLIKGMGYYQNDSALTKSLIIANDTIFIDGDPVLDSLLYDSAGTILGNDTLKVSQPNISKVLRVNEQLFLASNSKLFIYEKSPKEILLSATFPNRQFTELQLKDNLINAWSYDKVYSQDKDKTWSVTENTATSYEQIEISNKRIKAFDYDINGNAFLGSWGQGIQRSNSETNDLYTPESGYCLRGYSKEYSNFAVVSGLAADKRGGMWFANFSGDVTWKYTIGYIDNEGEMTCYHDLGTGKYTGAIKINPNDSNELGVVYYGGIDIFDISDKTPVLKKTINGDHVKDLFLMDWDGQNRIWAQGASRLLMQCPDHIIDGICLNSDFKDSLLDVTQTFKLNGSNFNDLESDALGNLWISTSTKGAFRIEASKDSLKGNNIKSFNAQSGLLSDNLMDIKANKNTGEIWFLHSDGITRYFSQARNSQNFDPSNVVVFPNPWRASQHTTIKFDGIPQNSSIHIFNEARLLVKFIDKDQIVGGYYEWSLDNQNSHPINGGVYTYVVKTPQKQIKGHLLIVK